METPKTWLAAIVRPNAVYIQAYIFNSGYGYISDKTLVLTNLSDNTSESFDLIAETNETCLFKYNQALNPIVNKEFKLELKIDFYSYETDRIIKTIEAVEFLTPAVWSTLQEYNFDVRINSEIIGGKTTIEPKINVLINGGLIPNNSMLRICGSNSTSPAISYNSYDTMREFILDGTKNLFSNIFRLETSGTWNFKAFLRTPNSVISESPILTHFVNQGDIYIVNIVETNNIIKLEQGVILNFNQEVGGKRVGISTVNEANTLQKGSFYEFHNNSGQWYFDFKESLKKTIYRLPTIVELESYCAIKSNLVGVQPISYYSSDIYEGTNNIKGFSFNSGAPTTIYAGDASAGYLLLEDFENNIAVAEPLGVPVFRSNLMVQPSGYKITDFAKNVDLYNYMSVEMLINNINLLSITTAPEFEYGVPYPEGAYGGKYYNSTTKKIYTAFDVMPGLLEWVDPQNPSIGVTYNFNGISYLWDGIDLQKININSGVLDNFEEATY